MTTPAEALKQALRDHLRVSMRAREAGDMAFWRALIAAVDNAEAVPVDARPWEPRAFGSPDVETERRVLSKADLVALLTSEAQSRRTEAQTLAAAGAAGRAHALLLQAGQIERIAGDLMQADDPPHGGA